MNIQFSYLFALVAFVASSVFADQLSYSEAQTVWEKSKNKPGYGEYASEFAQYNNDSHLDTKDNCYKLSPERVILFLVLTSKAVIESAITDVDNEKAKCFRKTYTGLPVKAPPFSPFVLKMSMEGS